MEGAKAFSSPVCNVIGESLDRKQMAHLKEMIEKSLLKGPFKKVKGV